MTENTDLEWLEHDLNIVKHILKSRHMSDTYVEMLIGKLKKMFDESYFDEITVPMVRNAIVYDLGRVEANKIADYFDQMRKSGTFEHPLIKKAREKGYLD